MKVLILKPSSLGDVVQALPVLRLLKLHDPASEVYWWIDRHLSPLLEGDPDLAGVIPFERQRWRSPWHWTEAWRSVRAIRRQRFDWVIDLQCLARSAAVAWLANGNFTIGLDDRREGAPACYDRAVPRPSPSTHAVDWYLSVLDHLGVPTQRPFVWLPQRPGVAAVLHQKWPVDGSPWIMLQPGARWPNKRWPVERFAEVVRLIAAEFAQVRFAVLGGASDRSLGRALAAAAAPRRCLDLTGQTSLTETIEWIRLSRLMVTNDTGPMHLAAALGKPVVALFGPTDPRRTGPYHQLHGVLRASLPCAPCLKDICAHSQPLECLHRIPPAEVVARVRAVLHPAARSA